MANMNEPARRAPHDPSPDQPFRITPGWPGAAAGYGPPTRDPRPPDGQGPPPGGLWPRRRPGRRQRPGRRGRLPRWAGAIAAAALLAAGGTVGGLRLAGSATAGSGSVPANGAKAVALNDALSSAAAPAGASGCRRAASSPPTGRHSGARHCGRALLRLVRGMYGEVAFHGAAGTVTLAFERGTVQSAAGGHLVVRAASGMTWTWNLAAGTVIGSRGGTRPASTLASGTRVFVAGPVSGGARDARLVIVRAGNGSSPRKYASWSPETAPAA
jgi:hypothetical protein